MEIAKRVKPSARGEMEIAAVNQAYLDMDELHVILFGRGMTWLDTGTPAGLLKAAELVGAIQRSYVSCMEEITWKRGFIDNAQLRSLGEEIKMTEYGQYLRE